MTTEEFYAAIGRAGEIDDNPMLASQGARASNYHETYAQLADIMDSVTGRTVRRVEWSVPHLQDELAQEPDDDLKKYRVVFAQGRGVSWDADKTFNAARGIEVTGVEQWARENLISQ